MTTFPNSPRLLKGAIVSVKPTGSLGQVIVFQYNPDTLTRTLTARMMGGGETEKGEPLRFKGPPDESIKLDVEIDTADQLEEGQTPAISLGIYPALSALEALLYPDSAQVIANDLLLSIGCKEIIPPEAPLTLFVWGPKRVLPVRLVSLSITEEAFDQALNPIRAKVSLEMRALSYQELDLKSIGGAVFMAYQIAKESMARVGLAASLEFKLNLTRGS
jgi:hypothetical protein